MLLHVCNIADRVKSRVFCQGHWDFFEGVSKSANSILLHSLDLVGLVGNLDCSCHFGGATAGDDVVVFDHVSDDTEGIVKGSVGFVTDGLGASSDEHGDSLGVGASLDQYDFVVGRSERHLLYQASLSELF